MLKLFPFVGHSAVSSTRVGVAAAHSVFLQMTGDTPTEPHTWLLTFLDMVAGPMVFRQGNASGFISDTKTLYVRVLFCSQMWYFSLIPVLARDFLASGCSFSPFNLVFHKVTYSLTLIQFHSPFI